MNQMLQVHTSGTEGSRTASIFERYFTALKVSGAPRRYTLSFGSGMAKSSCL
eukprot:m.11747 g.11747  ORF g.11747 m.11747 type:complete len:52 (-) comp4512_c0_seq1:293-448(-)